MVTSKVFHSIFEICLAHLKSKFNKMRKKYSGLLPSEGIIFYD